MQDPLARFDAKRALQIRQRAESEYETSFEVSFAHAVKARGENDGLTAAESFSPTAIDPKLLKNVRAEYERGFVIAYERAMRERGAIDGRTAAASVGGMESDK